MFRNDWNWIVAGVAAAILLPALTVLGLPFVIAAIVAAIAFAGLLIVLSPRRLFEGLDLAGVGRDRLAFARDLLTEAAPAADRLASAGQRIADKAMRTQVDHLAAMARDVFTQVEASPARASGVRRFLSYYLPRAAELAEGYAVLEDRRAPDPARLAEVGAVIGKLEDAFVHYADSLADQELGTLDVDLRLLQASLKEDLG